MILTSDEIAALTRRDRPTAQARVLRLLGIPFAVHPVDATVIVSRVAAEAVLGAPVGNVTPNPEVFEVNVKALRHGTSTSSR